MRVAAGRGELGRGRLDQPAELDQILEEGGVDPAGGMPRQDIGIEKVPGLAQGHMSARTPARDHQALGRQDLERLANRLAADVVIRRQLRFARQQGPLGDRAGGDPATDLMGDLAVQSRRGIETFVDQGIRMVGRKGWRLRKSCINVSATAKVVHDTLPQILRKSLPSASSGRSTLLKDPLMGYGF